MSDLIQCCPVCGDLLSYKDILCCCGYSKSLNRKKRKELRIIYKKDEIAYIPIDLYNSINSKQYYEDLSLKKFGDKDKWEEIFIEEELSQNPLFDTAKYQKRLERETIAKQKKLELLQSKENRGTQAQSPVTTTYTQPNKPHCPTCSSTNVHKISDLRRGVHAAMWGLLSTTAKCQYECKNCGYKF